MSSIAFECEQCGKAFQVSATLAGKTGRCKQCGATMTIPSARPAPAASPGRAEPVVDPYGLDEDDARPARRSSAPVGSARDDDDDDQATEAAESVLPARSRSTATASPARSVSTEPKKKKKKKKKTSSSGGGFAIPWREIGGGIGTVFFVLLIIFRVARVGRIFIPRGGNGGAAAVAGDTPIKTVPDMSRFQNGPIALPTFPDLGPATTVQPGIMRHEVVLGPTNPPIGTPPGQGGKLWVYLPAGQAADRSLPAILIAGAGSNLISGMILSEEDQGEHLPYVRAGFAVVAFEIDGDTDDSDEVDAATRFLAARAGLVNAHIALEYALSKVPAIDPTRISIAGHSSAGTLAVLFAEHEQRLRSAVAFAPALDLEANFGAEGMAELRSIHAGDLATRYAPKNNVFGLSCPLFLFHARDDSNIPASLSEAFAAQAKAAGRNVTLEIVPTGDHYQAMLQQGIPRAIAWLRGEATTAR